MAKSSLARPTGGGRIPAGSGNRLRCTREAAGRGDRHGWTGPFGLQEVGLQEVALWRTGDVGVLDGTRTPATPVAYDFLGLLQSELAALGQNYEVAVTEQGFTCCNASDLMGPNTFTQRADLSG